MADYGLPDPVLSQIQGGFAPDPSAPSGVSMAPDIAPPMDATALHPAILSYLTGQPQGDIYLQGPRGDSTANPPPPPPPPPPPSKGMGGGGQGPGTLSLGAAPIAPGVTGGPQAAPEMAATVPSVTGGALPTEPTSLTPPPQQPDFAATAPTPPPPPTAAEKKQAAAQAAFAASPEGQSQRADQLKMQAVNQGQQAINDELAGTEAQNTAVSNALADSQKRQAQQAQIAAQKQAQDEAAKQKLTQQWGQQVQDAANYKVNDDRSVGLGGLIAIALSGIGDALDHRHGPNAAAQIIDAGIQKRIDDQYRQKQALYTKAGATKGLLDEATGQVVDDRTQQQLDLAAEHTRVADQIDSIKAQFANPIAKARAEQLSADQRVKAANIVQGAADRQIQNNRAAQEERDRQAQLGLAAQERKDRLAYQNKMLDLERQKIGAANDAAQAKAAKAEQDDVNERGFFVPTNYSVDENGQIKNDYLPAKQADGTIYKIPKDRMKDVPQYKTAAMQSIDDIDQLIALRKANGEHVFNTTDARLAQQALGRLQVDMSGMSGTKRVSKELLDQMQKIATGGADPNSVRDVLPNMLAARKGLVDNLNTFMRNANYTGPRIDPPSRYDLQAPADTEGDEAVKRDLEYEPGAQIVSDPLTGRQTTQRSPDLPDPIKAHIDSLVQIIHNPKLSASVRQLANNDIYNIAQNAATSAIRDYAQSAATSGNVNSMPTPDE